MGEYLLSENLLLKIEGAASCFIRVRVFYHFNCLIY